MVYFAVFPSLIAFLMVFLFIKQIGKAAADFITCGALIISALASIFLAYDVIALDHGRVVTIMQWISSGSFDVDWALRLDSLSVVMLCVITIVSACVHIYSIGYMEHDEHKPRFMSYLSLFTFAMIMLVTSDNLLQLFFGWEGVGLASYLLIGFWNHKNSANKAAMKAFIVNRVGDFGLTLGVFTTFMVTGSIQFDAIFASIPSLVNHNFVFFGYEIHAITLIGLLLFIGAVGKSAQLGLHTWLPDAMEGPTPVSALIHAATMVTAGVFLVSRFSPLYEFAPIALMVICVVGALTSILAATIALTQFDIKRVIAYSTMSQLGYMFLALGVSAYGAAMFHLVTHAFFKALLFLGAGSVIHACSDEQDIRKMGQLWNKIPVTYAMMWIGSLALAGVPFFAGYYSKDIMLEAAWSDHTWQGDFAFWVGIIVAFMTAFYSFRILFTAFHGADNKDEHVASHVHESPNVMLMPLYVLAVGAVFSGVLLYGGFVGSAHHGDEVHASHVTHADHSDKIHEAHHKAEEAAANLDTYIAPESHIQEAEHDVLATQDHDGHVYHDNKHSDAGFSWDRDHFWKEAIFVKPENDTVEFAHSTPFNIKILPSIMGVAGILLAAIFYLKAMPLARMISVLFKPLHILFYRKWFFDEIYTFVFVRSAWLFGRGFSNFGDRKVIDGLGPNGMASVSRITGGMLSRFQSGYIYQYAFVMVIGLLGLIGWGLSRYDQIIVLVERYANIAF